MIQGKSQARCLRCEPQARCLRYETRRQDAYATQVVATRLRSAIQMNFVGAGHKLGIFAAMALVLLGNEHRRRRGDPDPAAPEPIAANNDAAAARSGRHLHPQPGQGAHRRRAADDCPGRMFAAGNHLRPGAGDQSPPQPGDSQALRDANAGTDRQRRNRPCPGHGTLPTERQPDRPGLRRGGPQVGPAKRRGRAGGDRQRRTRGQPPATLPPRVLRRGQRRAACWD